MKSLGRGLLFQTNFWSRAMVGNNLIEIKFPNLGKLNLRESDWSRESVTGKLGMHVLFSKR